MRSASLLIGACLLVSVLSCASPQSEMFWLREDVRFLTRDLEVAQEHVPFAIVVPTYMPDDIRTQYWIEGYLMHADPLMQGLSPPNAVKVILAYQKPGCEFNSAIELIEMNYPVHLPDPISNPEYSELIIGGCRVLVCEHAWHSTIQERETGTVFHFWWPQGDITFHLNVNCHSRDEAIKIVQSIIEQEPAAAESCAEAGPASQNALKNSGGVR